MTFARTRIDFDIILDIVPKQAKVLDLGCGDGELLVRLAQQKSVVGRGIELSELGVRQCVARGLSVRQGNIDEGLGDYPTASFDYVILSQTLPYIDEPKAVLGEMLRVGEQAIVSFPNMAHWQARLRLLWTGKLPDSVFSNLPWYESPRARPISIDGFLSFCAREGIVVAESILLNGSGRLRGMLRTSLFATTGVFVLRRACARSAGQTASTLSTEKES